MRAPLLPGLSLGLLLIAPAAAQRFTLDQTSGGDTFGARSTGQTFTPDIGTVPAPGAAFPVLQLTEVTLYHGNYASASPSTTTYLKLYDGDPTGSGAFVGCSTNTVDTTGLTFHSSMHWEFAQLPLITTTEYWAVMCSTNSATSIDAAEVSLETASRTIPSPGAYAGGSGLIANIVQHNNSTDARFEIVFHNGTIGSFTVSGTGCPSSAGMATLSAPTPPAVGQPFQVDFANVAPAALHLAAIGFSDTSWGGTALPLPLSTFVSNTAASCLILVSPDTSTPLGLNGTTASWSWTLPGWTGLAGLNLFIQGVQLEAAGISLTDKGDILIGN